MSGIGYVIDLINNNMTTLQTLKIIGTSIGLYIAYKLGLELWCIVYGMIY